MSKEKMRIARVVAVVAATLLILAACGIKQSPASTDNIFGLATRHGVCAKPQLAQQLKLASTVALQLVPPFASFQGDDSAMVSARFTGVANVVIDERLVKIDDIRQLTPCAPDDRARCATGAGTAMFADGTAAAVNPSERFDVHAPWRFRNHQQTWVTANGRPASINAPLGRCER